MEFNLKTQERQTTNNDYQTNRFEKYNTVLQNYIQNMESKEVISVDATSEFNTTNCKFL